MAKAQIGKYGIFTTHTGGVRFHTTDPYRLVKQAEVPTEVQVQLKEKVGIVEEPRQPSGFEQATEGVKTTIEQADTPLTAQDFEEPTVQEVVDELQGMTIHDAPLQDIARVLKDRFNIYTIWAGNYPEPGEIYPLSGEPMTSYERGLAYQAARRAEMQGRLKNVDYEVLKQKHEEAKMHSQEIRATYNEPVRQLTPQQNQAQNNFDYRTSVEGQRQLQQEAAPPQLEHYVDESGQTRVRRSEMSSRQVPGESEPVAEPPVNSIGGVVNPNW